MVEDVCAPVGYGSVLPLPKTRDGVPLLPSALRRSRERRPQIQIAMPAMRAIAAAPMAMPAIAPGARPEWPPVEVAALAPDEVAAGVGVTVTVAGSVALLVVPYSPCSSDGSGPSVGHLSPA